MSQHFIKLNQYQLLTIKSSNKHFQANKTMINLETRVGKAIIENQVRNSTWPDMW